MKLRTLPLLLVALLWIAACRSSENDNSETATVGSFQLVADEVLRPAVDSLIDGFMKENPKAKITVRYVSAGEAVQELLDSTKARAILIGRGLSPLEKKILDQYKLSLPEFDMAQQGIGCVVSAKSPLAALALSDLRTICSNHSTNWADLKHSIFVGAKPASATIAKILPAYPSSIEYRFDSLFLQPGEVMQMKVLRYQSTDSILARVASDPNAIGFVGSSWKHWYESHGDSSVKVIPIIPADSSSTGVTQPIIMHLAYIYQGLYPLTSRVEGFTFENPNTLPRGFMAYAMTAHGQTIFKNFEILPSTQIIKIVPSR